ncbi:putative Capsular polysaccharide biosynthesis glycosyl transferase [Flavobacteriaceae bacterium 3519-10]|nr:putative Capsular polysaccharide biosynthesis glycosyl transferase [Flavobacteriaceae bacterium 3519-10]
MKLFRIATVPISLNILLSGQLRFLNTHFDVTAVSGSGKDLDRVAEREGVNTHSVRIERKISILHDIVSLIRLYLLFRREKPTVIHSITPKAGLLSMIAGKWAGVPVRMHTFTGLIFPYRTGILRFVLVLMDRLLCSCATNIYPEGNGVKEDLLKYRITAKPLKVVADGNVNGVDTGFFCPRAVPQHERNKLRRQLGISPNDFVFIFVGRLVKDKGINELITAFEHLKKTYPEPGQNISIKGKTRIKLLLVGPMEPKESKLSRSTLHEIKTNPSIISVGYQDDVRSYYAASDALVFPSYREGFPNVVLQAGAMSLPAIVTDISGCNEIIKDGVNGYCIPSRNAEALGNVMLKLINDPKHFSEMKHVTRLIIRSKYQQATVWKALLSEYYSNLETLEESSVSPEVIGVQTQLISEPTADY